MDKVELRGRGVTGAVPVGVLTGKGRVTFQPGENARVQVRSKSRLPCRVLLDKAAFSTKHTSFRPGMTQPAYAKLDTALATLLAGCGYMVASSKLAAVSWDGSWYLFRSLQDRAPFIPHGRYGTYPLLWIIVQASRVIEDPKTLGVCYGLLLSIFPLGSLALCWHYLRDEDRIPLRVWPALGILLTPLPGQFCLMSEATPAAQLLWPILAILSAGLPGTGSSLWLALLSIDLFFLHPTAALIFVLAAFVCGWQALRGTGHCKREWTIWAGVFSALAIGKLLLTICSATVYERSQLSGKQMMEQLNASILGAPLVLLVMIYLLGSLILAETGIPLRLRPPAKIFGILCLLVCLVITGVGVGWAMVPVNWQGSLDYRRFVLPALVPILALAFWHWHNLPSISKSTPPPARSWMLSGIAAVFATVMVTQSVSWGSLIERFTQELSSTRTVGARPFVTAEEIPFTRQTILRHWTACPLSLLLQGRQPRKMYVLHREDINAQGVRVNPWERISLDNGWFELGRFQANGTDQK